MTDRYDIETVDALPEKERAQVPALVDRQLVRVGDLVRLLVFVNGERYIAPWVTVIECSNGRYYGEVGGALNSQDWKPYGSVVEFGADNIIELAS